LPGIGKEIGARIEEYLTTGRIELLERLRENLPPNFLSLLEVRGLGPRTARALWEVAGIDTVERLEEACRSGRIIGVAGIQKKTCENLLKAIAQHKAGRARALLTAAREVARQVALALSAHGGVDRLEIAGSLRRMRETVKAIDILVTSTDPARVIEPLASLPSVCPGSRPSCARTAVRSTPRGRAGCPPWSSARTCAATCTITRSGRTATIRSSASSRRPRRAATSTSSCPITPAPSRSRRA